MQLILKYLVIAVGAGIANQIENRPGYSVGVSNADRGKVFFTFLKHPN
jgi:hypothetical protein